MASFWQKLLFKEAPKPPPAPLQERGVLPYSQNPYTLRNHMSYLQNNDGSVEYFPLDNTTNIKRALDNCPAVPYIINKKARAFCSGNISAVYESSKKAVTGLNKIYQEIIDKPNFLQTGYQFKMQNYAQMQAYGYSICLKIMAGGQLSSIWALPNELVTIEWEYDWHPFKRQNIISAIKSIKYCNEVIDKKDIYIFTDSTPYDTEMILPVSRLRPLKYPIDNLIINYQSRGKLMNKPMGILTSNIKDDISDIGNMDPAAIEKVHQQFDAYGLSTNQKRFIITSTSLDWKPISFPLSDMQMDIFERNDTITIAEGLDYPPFLLGISEKGIYNNVSEAQKGLYTGSIIPDGENYVQQLVQCFNSAEKGIIYVIDFTHLAVLQEGLKAQNEARKILGEAVMAEFKNNNITYGRMMELMSEKTMNEAWKELYYFEMPYVKQQAEADKAAADKPLKDETKNKK